MAAFVGFVGAIWLLLLWVGDHATTSFEMSPPPLDPILGAQDRVEIHESNGPFIPMPDHLKTHDEMVAWMTKELPKLTADLSNHRG
jgi:hypothetical protein